MLDPQVKLVNSTRLERMKEGTERRAAAPSRCRAERIDAVNLHYTDWNAGLVALFHRFERFCLAWDLRYEGTCSGPRWPRA